MHARLIRIGACLVLALGTSAARAATRKEDRAQGGSLLLLHYAVLRAGPKETFPVVARVAKGVRVSVLRTRDAWTKVATQSGPSGWVPRDLLGGGPARAPQNKPVATGLTVDGDDVAPETLSAFAGRPLEGRRFEPPPPRVLARLQPEPTPSVVAVRPASVANAVSTPPRHAALPWLELGAGAGMEASQQSLSSASRAPLGSYVATMTAASLDASALVRARPRGPWEIAAQARYRVAAAPAGVRLRVSGGPIEELAVAHEQTTFSLALGWRSRRGGGLGLLARGGYHLESTQIDRGRAAALPSEHLQGPTAGLTLDAPSVAGLLDLRIDADALVHAEREQTAGLREGTQAPTFGGFARASARYRVEASWTIELAYAFAQTRTALTGVAERLPDVDHASRTTTAHLITLGTTYTVD